MTARRTPPIAVRIESLVLDGVAPGDPRVAQAVEQAARRALAAQPRAARAAAGVRRGAIGIAVGAAVARRAPR
jgi:hypothetical protein